MAQKGSMNKHSKEALGLRAEEEQPTSSLLEASVAMELARHYGTRTMYGLLPERPEKKTIEELYAEADAAERERVAKMTPAERRREIQERKAKGLRADKTSMGQ